MILFYLLISVMPLSQHPLWERFAGGLTMIKYLGGGCLLYALIYIGARRTPPYFFETVQARWFILLAMMAMVSSLTMGAPISLEVSPFFSYLSFMLLFFITLAIVDSVSRLRWVLLTSVGSVGIASLYVLREWQKYHSVYAAFRPGWITGDANYFSLSAILCLPLAFYFMQDRQPRWQRVFCLTCLLLTLAAVTLAASRGGLLGVVVAFLITAWRSGYRFRNLTVVSALLLAISLIAPSSPVQRFLDPSYSDVEAVESRLQTWEAGLKMLWQNPLIGIGLGNFKPLVEHYTSPEDKFLKRAFIAHNTYIELGAELGFMGLVSFLVILMGTLRTLRHVRRRVTGPSGSTLALLTQGIEAGLIGYAVAAFFVSAEYQKLFWLMVFISMCLPRLVREDHVPKAELTPDASEVGIMNKRIDTWWSTTYK